MKRILLIEDDHELVGLLDFHLSDEGFAVDYDHNGICGFKKAKDRNYDLIILDVNLPDKNGFEICRELRSLKLPTPILMLSLRSEEIDCILGLEFGADDYVGKPFSVRELIARIKAIFRRMEIDRELIVSESAVFFDRGDLKIDLEKRKVERNGQIIKLTPTEFELLALLASNPGKNYSKETLLDKVWGYEFHGFKHTVSSHINRLRSKIELDPNEPSYVLTTWGIGYRFTENW